MKKTGTVRFVAKSGGLKFENEDVWYNPVEEIKPQISPVWKGKNVALDLVGPATFADIQEVEDEGALSRDELIVRQVAIKTAAEFAKAKPALFHDSEDMFDLAEKINAWINEA